VGKARSQPSKETLERYFTWEDFGLKSNYLTMLEKLAKKKALANLASL
jgi:hypothetical protein